MTANALVNIRSRFDALTLRERALVGATVLLVMIFAWDRLLMEPLRARERQLMQELSSTRQSLAALTSSIEANAHDNPVTSAINQRQRLLESLAAVDRELESASAGLIAPERMLAVLRDVLEPKRDLKLISMRNLPVTRLAAMQPTQTEQQSAGQSSGPYVHSLELVIEGAYLDVLRYLEDVERLPWRFYWQVFELKTAEYPRNRVRIRLSTLSMEQEWLGV